MSSSESWGTQAARSPPGLNTCRVEIGTPQHGFSLVALQALKKVRSKKHTTFRLRRPGFSCVPELWTAAVTCQEQLFSLEQPPEGSVAMGRRAK